ncbi:MAG TPA: hypothetical protein PKO15_02310 [Fibrobacteria bacterium]|nr:hypothetical protein [Fibrobacteria bacterium]
MSSTEHGIGLLIKPLILILKRVGIDQAVFYTAGAKLFQAMVQFAVLGALAKNLSPYEQGYYYTFQSVLALQIFFELGMTSVLIQATSHEAAPLDLAGGERVPESSEAGRRLASLLHYLVRWYLTASVLFFVCVLIVGVVFFEKSQGGLQMQQWVGAWLLSTLMTAVSMVFQAIVAFSEGIGRISLAAKVRAVQGVCTVLTLFVAMTFGLGLYSPGAALFVGLFAGGAMLWKANKNVLLEIWRQMDPDLKIHWTKDLWGFQWRMALSWVSGYLIFQFSTPVVFKLLGSVEAGKYGITQQVVNGISALSMAWATTRQARWGRWIAMNDRFALDADFRATLKRTFAVNALLAVVFVGVMEIGRWFFPIYTDRFAPLSVTIVLLSCGAANQIIFTQATYLRAHKQEPFLWVSIAGAVLVGVGSFVFAHMGILAVATVYLFSTLVVGLGAGTWIFVSKKREWQRAHDLIRENALC